MTVSVRRTAVPLTALVLVVAAVAGCAGPGGDPPARAGASPAVTSPAAAPSASAAPGDGDGDGGSAPPAEYAALPLSVNGRTPVFRHGPRDEEEPEADREDEREKGDDEENRKKSEKTGNGEETEKSDDRRDRVVALTFDAAMSPEDEERAEDGERYDNPALIATLRREKVPATVFMSGVWARTYKHQAHAIGRERLFEVGNLSYSHHAFTRDCEDLPALDPERQLADVRKGLKEIRAAGVSNPTPYFRFPGGCHDDRSRRAIAPAGVTAVAGDVVAPDTGATDAEEVAERVLEDVGPGSVVVLHANRDTAPVTEKVVRRIVPELKERGYRLVRVSDLIASATGRD